MRSPFFYVGDKYKLIREIKTYFPLNIDKFIEPFVGGGSVFMNVSANQFHLNDIDKYVIELHKFLCRNASQPFDFYKSLETIIQHYNLSYSYKTDDVPLVLKHLYKKTYFAKYNKKAYEQMRKDFNEGGRSDFRLLYLLLIYGFNRMLRFNKRGNFNLPVGNVDFNANVVNALNDYFEQVINKHPTWYNKDYKIFIDNLNLSKNDFIYFDPPYLITSSKYNKIWNEHHEIELLALLDSLNEKQIKFAVSNVIHYKNRSNNIFIHWSDKYNVYPVSSNYINYHDNTIKKLNEVLVTNY